MNLNTRAYSFLKIKSIDEEERTITGIATTPTADSYGDIVEPEGAEFKLPLPFLYQHNSREPIGHVTSAKVAKDGITVTIKCVKSDEPGTLKDRLDEAWQAIKIGLVRGLSIGFSAIEYSFIEATNGVRYTRWMWLELSAVTIPANSDATMQTIRSIDTRARAASGTRGNGDRNPGVSGSRVAKATTVKLAAQGTMKTIGEQIEGLQSERLAKMTAMEAIMTKSAESGETLDSSQADEFETLQGEVEAIDTHLARLSALEKMQAKSAKPVQKSAELRAEQTAGAGSSNGQTQVVVTAPEKLEKGIEFARYAMCKLAAKGNPMMAVQLAKTHYAHNNRVVKALEFEATGRKIGTIMKAAVEAGTTLDDTWAGPLVDYQNFAGDFVEFLRPQTIVGQFGTGSIPSLNRIPFNVRIGGQTTGGDAHWVGEGKPKPLTKFDFTATELRWAKIAAISVLTNELIRFSSPSAERLVRDSLAAAVIARADTDFIDPNKTVDLNVSPASITNGATAIAATGTDATGIRCDLQALWAPFIAAHNPPRRAVYIMDSTTALALSLMMNPLGQPEFPGLTMNGGTFNGIPVIISDYVPSNTDGSIVVLANASDIWLADDGQVTIDASTEASLQMQDVDTATNDSSIPTETVVVSMFQTNSTAFRAERYINWARRRDSGVAYLTGVNWSTCVT